MKISYFKPSGILARYIKYYWVLEADAHEAPVSEYIIPTGNIELFFHFRKPFVVNKTTAQPQTFLSGLTHEPSEIATQGGAGVITITFYPHGACNFFPFSLSEAENQHLDLRLCFQKEVRILEEQLFELPDINQKIALVEKFLIKKLHPIKENDLGLIQQCVQRISLSKGSIQPHQISEQLAMSPRNLERKFGAMIGKTPKQYIRIVRFQHILKAFSDSAKNLTQIAYEHGYFDQAHFIKDFKALSGFSPGEFLSKFPSCPVDYLQE